MDAALPFVSSSDRSKYMELCQALSKLNSQHQLEDVEFKESYPEKIVEENTAPVLEVSDKVPQVTPKRCTRAKSVASCTTSKACHPHLGNKQVQELLTRRSATPRATSDQRRKQPASSLLTAMQPYKFLQHSRPQSTAQHSVNGKQIGKQDVREKSDGKS